MHLADPTAIPALAEQLFPEWSRMHSFLLSRDTDGMGTVTQFHMKQALTHVGIAPSATQWEALAGRYGFEYGVGSPSSPSSPSMHPLPLSVISPLLFVTFTHN